MRTDRRTLLAGAAALAAFPPALARAMTLPAHNRTGTLQDVEHIVVFMQENRAFDHYFGRLAGVRGFGDPRPLRQADGRTVWRQASDEHPDGHVAPFHGDSRSTDAYVIDGAGQGHHDNLTILNGGRWDRWGATRELHKRMAFYGASDLAYYHALASAFTVCDAYHSSTLTQTYPNRLHLWTGCNGGGGVGGDPVMSNHGEDQTPSADQATDEEIPGGPLTWTTYPERLEAAGVSWKVYQEYDNFGDNILSVFAPFRPAPRDSALYRRGRAWVSEGHPDPAMVKRSTGELLVEAFRRDLAANALPQISWIVAAADLSEHPSAAPAKGENVCAQLIEALVDHPQVFAKTIFIVNYDESGGFFDHMPPPTPPIGAVKGFSTVSVAGEAKRYGPHEPHEGEHPIGLGVRTPAIIVSPWSRGGYVCSQVFDHTSVLRLMEARFGVAEPNISAWRRSVCGDLTACFDFARPNRDWSRLGLPSTADHEARVARSSRSPKLTLPVVQAETDQDPTRRPSRPLPYAVEVEATLKAGRRVLEMANTGTVGAVFQVHDESGPEGPWSFTLGAGDRHAAQPWRADAPTLVVHGPDGFYRRFAGASPLQTRLRRPRKDGPVELYVSNAGEQAAAVIVKLAEAYGGERLGPWRLALQPGASDVVRWSLEPSDGWYDIVVSCPDDAAFEHRLAGRLHDGADSRTDPGIGRMIV